MASYDLSTYVGRQQARDAGNWVGADASGNTVMESSGGGGSSGGSGSGGTNSFLQASAQSSGFDIKDLEEKKRQFDADLAFKREQWEKAGLPAAEVDRRYREAQIQEIMSQMMVAQSNVGLDYLKTAASLGGPADYFQQSNFFRGAQANPALPTFLSALQRGLTMPAFQGTGAQAPGLQNMNTLAQQLTGMPSNTGQPASGQSNADTALSAIGQIGSTGGTNLAPQALEQLNPDEMSLFGSGLKASGFSLPTFLSSYQQSRIGQSAARPLG